MAVDVTVKGVNICSSLKFGAVNFMGALEGLLDKKAEKEGSGIDLTSAAVETAIDADPSLKHADGVDYNNVMASVAAVKAFMDANGHTGVFDKVRP
jgi:hypothetical protein